LLTQLLTKAAAQRAAVLRRRLLEQPEVRLFLGALRAAAAEAKQRHLLILVVGLAAHRVTLQAQLRAPLVGH
jgi:hypothetical protein